MLVPVKRVRADEKSIESSNRFVLCDRNKAAAYFEKMAPRLDAPAMPFES
jgi:hypothetical protein